MKYVSAIRSATPAIGKRFEGAAHVAAGITVLEAAEVDGVEAGP